ncbi:MAG: Na+/H+ antiporter NhaA [Solirubrobacteraceae bacterium]
MHRRRSAYRRVGDSAESFAGFLREETNGGKLLLVATAAALLWANVAHDAYVAFWHPTPTSDRSGCTSTSRWATGSPTAC